LLDQPFDTAQRHAQSGSIIVVDGGHVGGSRIADGRRDQAA